MQFTKVKVNDINKIRAPYRVMCEYDIYMNGFVVMFDARWYYAHCMVSFLVGLPVGVLDEETCLEYAQDKLHYKALQAFRESIQYSQALS